MCAICAGSYSEIKSKDIYINSLIIRLSIYFLNLFKALQLLKEMHHYTEEKKLQLKIYVNPFTNKDKTLLTINSTV